MYNPNELSGLAQYLGTMWLRASLFHMCFELTGACRDANGNDPVERKEEVTAGWGAAE